MVYNRVLVLGNNSRAFLSTIRSLGRKGIEVHISCIPNAIARKSKYTSNIVELPDYIEGNKKWINELCKNLSINKYDMVIPTDDQYIILLTKYKDILSKYSLLYLLEEDVYKVVNDKYETVLLANKAGVKTPESILLSDINSFEEKIESLNLPVVLKPHSSHTDKSRTKNYVIIIRTSKDLKKHTKEICKHIRRDGSIVLQQYVEGVGTGIEVITLGGKVLYAFQHLRVHEPNDGGASSYRVSIPLHPNMYEDSKKLLFLLNYSGVAMIEYKWNRKNDDYNLMEINGRFWGSLPLAINAGADFPYLLYKMLVLKNTNFEKGYKINIFCRNIKKDIAWMINKAKNNNYSIIVSNIVKGLWRIITFKEHIDEFAIDDIKPGFYEILKLIEKMFRLIFNRR